MRVTEFRNELTTALGQKQSLASDRYQATDMAA